jgi:copper chaperone CopZ
MPDMSTLKLKVVGQQTLHCDGCERTAEFTLSRLPGVKAVKADHKVQTIQVSMISGETDLGKVKAELERIGYQVELA